ncbi:MAG TPA: hypothetical protein VFS37_12880 [Conexibacter sp.]|nr:hypothetical protein [Conexibacter sp.]
MRLRALLVVLAVAAAVQLAACGGESGPATTTSSPTQATSGRTTPPTTTPQSGGIDTMAGASTRPVHAPASNRQTALLTDVRAARHEGFDRVVFAFRNVLPGYDVRYVSRPVHEDASGRTVPVAGGAVVRIRMEPALDADLSRAGAPRTYTGPLRFTPATPEVVELVRIGAFEGVLTWVAGVQDPVDFRVTTLTAPPRLIVDFRNH